MTRSSVPSIVSTTRPISRLPARTTTSLGHMAEEEWPIPSISRAKTTGMAWSRKRTVGHAPVPEGQVGLPRLAGVPASRDRRLERLGMFDLRCREPQGPGLRPGRSGPAPGLAGPGVGA